ncbi:MAG: DUF4124 domain-containing protein [Rhodanobacteraceae bacterium]
MRGLFVIVALAAAPCAALAQPAVYRCIGEHGEISFSSTRCVGASAPVALDPNAPAMLAPEGSRAKITCPVTAEAVRDVVAEAFARRDANTLAGVMRWDGVGSGAAISRMRELADLTARPLLGIDIDAGNDARPRNDPDEPAPARASDDGLLVVHTGSLDGGPSEHEFRLTPAGGCYWLDW